MHSVVIGGSITWIKLDMQTNVKCQCQQKAKGYYNELTLLSSNNSHKASDTNA